MRTGCVNLHGVTVQWSLAPIGYDPLEPLLARFPPVELAAPDLTVEIRRAGDQDRSPPESDGFRNICFFGPVLGYTREGDLLLSDGRSRVWVAPDGKRIIGATEGEEATSRQSFTSGMLFIGLMVALRHFGLFHMHAATVVVPQGPSGLIVGQSGAGKTTTALALVRAGWSYLGDDSLLLRQAPDRRVDLLGLPLDFHLANATAGAFPDLSPHLGEFIHENVPKRRLDPRAAGSRRLDHAQAPAAIVLPTIVRQPRSSLKRLPPAEAMSELLHASALLSIEGMADARAQVALLEALLSRASTWRLELGQDVLAEPALIARLLLESVGR